MVYAATLSSLLTAPLVVISRCPGCTKSWLWKGWAVVIEIDWLIGSLTGFTGGKSPCRPSRRTQARHSGAAGPTHRGRNKHIKACLGSSKWTFNGGHRYIRIRRTAATRRDTRKLLQYHPVDTDQSSATSWAQRGRAHGAPLRGEVRWATLEWAG
jgi:hypothetical protein